MSIDIEIRSMNDAPKCKNCHRWTQHAASPNLGGCSPTQTLVPDLSVCSEWQPVADVRVAVKRGAAP